MCDHVDISDLHTRILSYDAGAFPIINGKLARDYPDEHKIGSHHNIRIDFRGSTGWAVTYSRMCFGYDKKGTEHWEYEPSPSNRDDAKLSRYRFDSPEEALEAVNKWRTRVLAEWLEQQNNVEPVT